MFEVTPMPHRRSLGAKLLRLVAMVLLAPLVGLAVVAAAVVTSLVAVLFPNRR